MQEVVKIQSGKDLLKSFSKEEKPREVFGKYIHEGELCILFGDSNAGKSILANDIAFFVSGGGHKWPDMESPNIPSLYIDMEMTGKQFASRYHNASEYMTDDYSRAEMLSNSTEDRWERIRSKIISMQSLNNAPKFIVIDNITNGFGSIYSPKQMTALVTELKNIKSKFGLTILLIAHCPKRNKNKPITQDSLGGSKMIINFVDSAFAVGTSIYGEDIRYVKQIKARECEKDNKVMTVKIDSEPYLSFQYIDKTSEDVHLGYRPCENGYEMSAKQEIELVKLLSERREQMEHEETPNGHISFFDIASKIGIPLDVVVLYDIEHFS
jgi:RecA-family ATPase